MGMIVGPFTPDTSGLNLSRDRIVRYGGFKDVQPYLVYAALQDIRAEMQPSGATPGVAVTFSLTDDAVSIQEVAQRAVAALVLADPDRLEGLLKEIREHAIAAIQMSLE